MPGLPDDVDDPLSNMDRLSACQNGVDELITMMYSGLSYLSTKAAFRQVAPERPIRQLNPQADDEATFEANRKELVTDLIRKARQLEYLVSALPSPPASSAEGDASELAELEADLQAANRDYLAALDEAERLQKELHATLRTLLDRRKMERSSL